MVISIPSATVIIVGGKSIQSNNGKKKKKDNSFKVNFETIGYERALRVQCRLAVYHKNNTKFLRLKLLVEAVKTIFQYVYQR